MCHHLVTFKFGKFLKDVAQNDSKNYKLEVEGMGDAFLCYIEIQITKITKST
jgi:hypothetical protein